MTIERMRELVDQLEYKDWWFATEPCGNGFWLQARFMAADRSTTPPWRFCEQHCRKWYVSSHAIDQEVIQTAFKAVLAAEEHEAREQFRYRGRAIYGPHVDIDALWAAANQTVSRPMAEGGVR